jgi:hypothetical protein
VTIDWSRDGGEIDALVTDRYLDTLLARQGLDVPPAADERLHPAIPIAVGRLIRDLPRFHPSFRFEERLALRLAEVAASLRRGEEPAEDGTLLALVVDVGEDGGDPSWDARVEAMRPMLIRGAITSAAVSLAGAAFVVWRRSRPPGDPMARAARAVARARLS